MSPLFECPSHFLFHTFARRDVLKVALVAIFIEVYRCLSCLVLYRHPFLYIECLLHVHGTVRFVPKIFPTMRRLSCLPVQFCQATWLALAVRAAN